MAGRLVIVESPYAADTPEGLERNVAYARACLRDVLDRGDFPLASHLLYTQVLRDHVGPERGLGIAAGLAWARKADAAIFYVDRGWSSGMHLAAHHHAAHGIACETRRLGGEWALP